LCPILSHISKFISICPLSAKDHFYSEPYQYKYKPVTDVIQALIQQPDPQAARNYWKVLKNRLNKEGSESVTKCNRLKLEAAEGGGIAKKARN
jgi:hypothetical protein